MKIWVPFFFKSEENWAFENLSKKKFIETFLYFSRFDQNSQTNFCFWKFLQSSIFYGFLKIWYQNLKKVRSFIKKIKNIFLEPLRVQKLTKSLIVLLFSSKFGLFDHFDPKHFELKLLNLFLDKNEWFSEQCGTLFLKIG